MPAPADSDRITQLEQRVATLTAIVERQQEQQQRLVQAVRVLQRRQQQAARAAVDGR